MVGWIDGHIGINNIFYHTVRIVIGIGVGVLWEVGIG